MLFLLPPFGVLSQHAMCFVPGSVPVTKREKSMSSYLDTGSVLIESACNVERIAAVLHTLTPFIPGFNYYR